MVGEEGKEGVRRWGSATRGDAPVEGGLPLLGDGDAVVEETDGLGVPEGDEVFLDFLFSIEVAVSAVGEIIVT